MNKDGDAIDGSTLRYVSFYKIRKLEVPPEDVPQLQRFFDFVEQVSRTLLVLKRKS